MKEKSRGTFACVHVRTKKRKPYPSFSEPRARPPRLPTACALSREEGRAAFARLPVAHAAALPLRVQLGEGRLGLLREHALAQIARLMLEEVAEATAVDARRLLLRGLVRLHLLLQV